VIGLIGKVDPGIGLRELRVLVDIGMMKAK
jgi:hypothetical protein